MLTPPNLQERGKNLARQSRNQTCREWQVACGKWQAKKSSRLATKFRPSSTEATEMLCALRVDVCRPQSTREEIDSSEEDDNRRGANRSVLAGKGEAARLPVDAE